MQQIFLSVSLDLIMVKLHVDVLDESCLLDILSRTSEGQMASTFICNVRWEDGSVTQAFVKRFTSLDKIGISNEITGYIIANGCNLPIPRKVGLLQANDYCFDGHMLEHEVDDDYSEWCVVVSAAQGATPKSYYNSDIAHCKSLINLVASWDKLPDAISFDDWVANQDRNMGNLVIAGPNRIVLIDHSNLPVDLNWHPSDLIATKEFRNKLVEILDYFQHMPLPIKSKVSHATAIHPEIYNAILDNLRHWWSVLLADEDEIYQTALEHFLAQRANLGATRVSSTYQMLVG